MIEERYLPNILVTIMQGITLLISFPDNRFPFRRVVNARSAFDDIQYCRKRVVWCENVLDSEMFYAIKREMEKGISLLALML